MSFEKCVYHKEFDGKATALIMKTETKKKPEYPNITKADMSTKLMLHVEHRMKSCRSRQRMLKKNREKAADKLSLTCQTILIVSRG